MNTVMRRKFVQIHGRQGVETLEKRAQIIIGRLRSQRECLSSLYFISLCERSSMTTPMDNPLLDFSGLPRFAEFKPKYVTTAIDRLLADCRTAVKLAEAADTPAEWDAFVAPLDDVNEKLGRAWGQVSHLHSVMDSPELREVYNANLPKITVYFAEMGQNEALFGKYKALKARPDFETLSAPRKKIVDNELRDFRLGGAELPADKKSRFMQVQEELAQLSAKFEENLLDATNEFALFVDDVAQLNGVPDDVLAAMRGAAEADGKPGW
jgi:oligopeptidase A